MKGRSISLDTYFRAFLAGLELSYIAWQLDRLCLAFDLANPLDNFGSFGEKLTNPVDFDSMTVDTFLKLYTKFQSVRDIIQVRTTISQKKIRQLIKRPQ